MELKTIGSRMTRRSILLGAWATAAAAASRGVQVRQALPSFRGGNAGEERQVDAIKVCWCPPGRFVMGSPPDEPERRPGEDQVAVTLTRGFWMAKYETTQGQWKRVIGELPGELTAELPAGDDFPVGNVNFSEAEGFCQKLTELGRRSGVLPNDWEFRLPTEAQWEYACRAGTTTATSFGDKLGSKQANFKGRPYNGAEPGSGRESWQLPRQRLGAARHARQHLRVVPGLVSRETAGWYGSRLVFREQLGNKE